MPVIEGAYRYLVAGAYAAGTDAVQTITFSGAAVSTGTFTLVFGGFETAPITGNATPATIVGAIDAALEANPYIGTGGVVTAAGTYTAGAGTITVTFSGAALAKKPVDLMTVGNNSLTGAPTIAITMSTPGVRTNVSYPATGAVVINTTAGTAGINSGTPAAPTLTPL